MGTIFCLKLSDDVLDMEFYCVLADVDFVGYALVREAATHAVEYVVLAIGKFTVFLHYVSTLSSYLRVRLCLATAANQAADSAT